jgi:hypothetical protein
MTTQLRMFRKMPDIAFVFEHLWCEHCIGAMFTLIFAEIQLAADGFVSSTDHHQFERKTRVNFNFPGWIHHGLFALQPAFAVVQNGGRLTKRLSNLTATMGSSSYWCSPRTRLEQWLAVLEPRLPEVGSQLPSHFPRTCQTHRRARAVHCDSSQSRPESSRVVGSTQRRRTVQPDR